MATTSKTRGNAPARRASPKAKKTGIITSTAGRLKLKTIKRSEIVKEEQARPPEKPEKPSIREMMEPFAVAGGLAGISLSLPLSVFAGMPIGAVAIAGATSAAVGALISVFANKAEPELVQEGSSLIENLSRQLAGQAQVPVIAPQEVKEALAAQDDVPEDERTGHRVACGFSSLPPVVKAVLIEEIGKNPDDKFSIGFGKGAVMAFSTYKKEDQDLLIETARLSSGSRFAELIQGGQKRQGTAGSGKTK